MMKILIGLMPTLISLLTVILFYKKLHPAWLRLFFYFLVFTLAVDAGAAFYSQYFKKSNHLILNIYLPVNFGFYFLLFFKAFERRSFKRFASLAFILFILFYLCDIIFIEGFYYFNIYSFCLGSILIVLCCLLYFMWLFTSDRVMNYFKMPMFWISTGLLFFYTGNLVQMSLMKYIIDNGLDPGSRIYDFIMVTLNVLLYGAFTISFICNQAWRKPR
ncbi:MAG: hypothetical protein JWO92_1963 [Chitinophagaceae bacterium]|nr:hypothetical protein [Chitinophagaceae bacterium]MDB5223629.1 hypothetical protein [Chitinophagaceae bacterium]